MCTFLNNSLRVTSPSLPASPLPPRYVQTKFSLYQKANKDQVHPVKCKIANSPLNCKKNTEPIEEHAMPPSSSETSLTQFARELTPERRKTDADHQGRRGAAQWEKWLKLHCVRRLSDSIFASPQPPGSSERKEIKTLRSPILTQLDMISFARWIKNVAVCHQTSSAISLFPRFCEQVGVNLDLSPVVSPFKTSCF